MTPKKLEQIAKQIHDSMPTPVKELGADVDQKIRQVIQGSQLNKLDVVSREEFDVQTPSSYAYPREADRDGTKAFRARR